SDMCSPRARKLRARRHPVEAPWLALPLRPLTALGQEQEPKAPGSDAGSRRGLGEVIAKLDKTEIARRQLGTALTLFLEDSDPVSVHTLACAGCEIAEYLTHKAGEKPFSTHVLATFPDIDIGKIRQLQNQYWNAFKHAQTRGGIERQDSELLERFGDEVNDHTLLIGWHDYHQAVGTLPIEAQIFQVWYFALYHEKLNPEVDTTTHQRLFP